MKWSPRGRSRNLEDRRGSSAGRGPMRFPFPMGRSSGGGGRLPIPMPRGKSGIVTMLIVLGIFWYMGGDLSQLLGGLAGGMGPGTQVNIPSQLPPMGDSAPAESSPEEDQLVEFVSFVLDDLQETWRKLLPGYSDAKLVLFRGAVRSACGNADAAMGPFYCPADNKVYVDLGFYEELRRRFRAPGDFAQAYVLAHEIGHHVQRLTGLEERVRASQRQNPSLRNELSVRMELQADCLAGVWGHSTQQRGLLEAGDIEEGLGAAAAIGDDRIQGMSGGGVHPESFTHGSSQQRVEWFRRGFESGNPNACDSFASAK
jgi:predicted metalloprotease